MSELGDKVDAMLGQYANTQAALRVMWLGCNTLLESFAMSPAAERRVREMLEHSALAVAGGLDEYELTAISEEVERRIAITAPTHLQKRARRHDKSVLTDAQVIREWARSQGIHVNPGGPLRKDVIAAYEAARQDGAA